MRPTDKRIDFTVTLVNGEKVDVAYYPDFLLHLEFRGNISPTGYRSEFPYTASDDTPSLAEVKDLAQSMAQDLYDKNPDKYGVTRPLL